MLNTDAYLDIVVDDITALNGVEMYDAYNGCVFQVESNSPFTHSGLPRSKQGVSLSRYMNVASYEHA